ncbi:MAG: 16S rRNA (guanine(966)-N(2))-methyltransferase RsmD [Spirochaetota bacterium]
MRITGGRFRGRKVICPPGIIRPAMDRMRESLFSILGNIEGLSFLDLFSGSGLVGLEAASRGCNPVHLVESDRKKRKTIIANLAIVDEAVMQVFMVRVERFLRTAQQRYDIVYADPPFPMQGKQQLIEQIAASNLVAPEGLFIIHYPAEESLSETAGSLSCYDRRTYGRSRLNFYQQTSDSPIKEQLT